MRLKDAYSMTNRTLNYHRCADIVSYNLCGKTYATYKMLRIPRHDTQNVKLS